MRADDVGRALEGDRDVGQRPERAERDGARGSAPQRVDDEVDAVLRLQRHGGVRQVRAVEAGLAVDMLGGHELARTAGASQPAKTGTSGCRRVRR